jgi:hypothetical protein
VGGLLVGGLTDLDALVLPMTVIGLLLGVATVFAAPSHLPATAWLSDVYRYYLLRPHRTLAAPRASPANVAEATERTEGGVAAYHPFAVDERTQDLTNVERAWPGAGAIERTDGALVGMLELDPANMDFAMSSDWAQVQSVGEAFANNDLDFPLTVHATTRRFPVDRLIDAIENRLDDGDVTHAPVFRELLGEYRDTRPREMSGTQQHRYFLGVTVYPRDVYRRYQTEPSPAERLAELPGVGLLLTPFITRRTRLTEAELRAKLVDELDVRCRTVDTALVTKAAGWSARRVSTAELFVLCMEFWNGEAHTFGESESVVRSSSALQSRAVQRVAQSGNQAPNAGMSDDHTTTSAREENR